MSVCGTCWTHTVKHSMVKVALMLHTFMLLYAYDSLCCLCLHLDQTSYINSDKLCHVLCKYLSVSCLSTRFTIVIKDRKNVTALHPFGKEEHWVHEVVQAIPLAIKRNCDSVNLFMVDKKHIPKHPSEMCVHFLRHCLMG